MLVGYYALPGSRSRPRRELVVPRGALFLAVPAVLGFVGFVFGAIRARAFWGAHVHAPALFASVAQLKPVFLYAWGLAWLLLLSGRATPNQKRVIRFAIFPMALAVVLSDLAAKIIVMTIAGLPVIAYWYVRRQLPWRTLLVLLLLLVFVIFPFYNNYRVFDPDLPVFERVELTVRHISEWNAFEWHEETISTFKKRFALITSTAAVVRDVPNRVPYANGDTFVGPFFAFFVPRILWPDKPEFVFGREFGELFRIVHILDERTSIAATLPGELFWNFDLGGVLVGMALWGMLIRWFYLRYGASAELDPVRRAIYLVLLFEFSMFGAGIAAQLASMLRTVLLLEMLVWTSRRIGLLQAAPADPPGRN
jgi:hypothetical protein